MQIGFEETTFSFRNGLLLFQPFRVKTFVAGSPLSVTLSREILAHSYLIAEQGFRRFTSILAGVRL
jgi:hypothetical protein